MVRGRFAGAVVSPVIVAALWLGFAAQADADIHVQMISGQGLTVVSDDVSQVETIEISATAGSKWRVFDDGGRVVERLVGRFVSMQ